MTNIIEISEDAFAALFKPIANHLNPNASYDWGDGHGTLFETFDEELAFVQSQESARIWTLVDGDNGEYIDSGFHFVNRIGYFITEVAVPGGVMIQVPMPEVIDDTIYPEISPKVIQSLNTILGYLWHDEKNHYEGSEIPERKSHIFRSLKAVRKWLKSNKSNPELNGGTP